MLLLVLAHTVTHHDRARATDLVMGRPTLSDVINEGRMTDAEIEDVTNSKLKIMIKRK
jgi:hypothetical protein